MAPAPWNGLNRAGRPHFVWSPDRRHLLWGGYGGAILVEPDFQPGVAQVRTSFGTTGRSGGLQSHTSVQASERGWEARLAHAQNTGYRTWEGNERWQAELSRRWQGDKATHHTWLAVLDASWDLPGSVDSLTAAETPEFAPGGQYNAHVQRRRALAGHHVHVSDVTVFGNRSTVDVWTLMRLTDKVNPFGTSPFFNGYKEESGQVPACDCASGGRPSNVLHGPFKRSGTPSGAWTKGDLNFGTTPFWPRWGLSCTT